MFSRSNNDRRIITCEDCGGDGGHQRYDDHHFDIGWWICPLCEGRGSIEVPVEPITQADLTVNCPPPYIVEDDSE
jgi:DnaJ-class molecular chaperone